MVSILPNQQVEGVNIFTAHCCLRSMIAPFHFCTLVATSTVMAKKKLPLRPNVCMLLFNKDGKLFLGERSGPSGRWQFPQGGAEPELSLKRNVVRELREELGLKPKHLGEIIKLESTHEYDWEKPPGYARNRWRGQTQTFWLIEFIGKDSDIDLAAGAVDGEDQELMSWKWCTIAQVKRLAEPKRLDGYSNPLKEFAAYIRASR